MGAKAMKRVMKAKKVSKVAKGKRARASVLSGKKEKTMSGLTKDALKKNKAGKIVSKKASAASKKRYATSGAKKWACGQGGAQGAWGDGLRGLWRQVGRRQGPVREGQVFDVMSRVARSNVHMWSLPFQGISFL